MLTSPLHAAERPGVTERPVMSTLLTSPGVGPNHAPTSTTHIVSVVRVDKSTGKLIRSVAPAPSIAALAGSARPFKAPPQIDDLVQKSARAHGVDPLLVHSVIQVESAYNTHAISPMGAEGLMQLMPGTSAQLGVGNSFDPGQNIEAGVRYLKSLQTLYHDDRLALAAYNAGPSAVDKYKNIPPYAETVNYVEQVGARYRASHDKAERDRADRTAANGPLVPLAFGNEADYTQDELAGQVVGVNQGVEKEVKHPKLEQYLDDQGRLYLKTAAE